jgi:5-methylthioadenosine/S-adenosylhomocysteine deaminase
MNPPTCDLLLAGGTVVTCDDERTVLAGGSVAIAGDRIVAVGPAEAVTCRAERTVDCAGKAVMPGLIDCHTHLFQSLARGLGEGLDGWSWLARLMWPYAGAITPEDTLAAVRLGAVEAVRAGTTALLDHHYGCADAATTLKVAAAIEDVGLRGVVARGIAGPRTELAERQGLPGDAFRHGADEELELTRECMDARPADDRVAVWPGPINIVYTDEQLCRDAVELARERGTGWHTHFCAPHQDPDLFASQHGQRPAEWLHGHGLLGPDAVLAHCTWLDDGDIELIGATATAVTHCPLSNQYMPYGVMPLRRLRERGATVALGTDGSACGHRQDMFEQMKLTVLLHRVASLSPTESGAAEALDLATREGARALGVDAGMLDVGRLADVAIVDLQKPHLQPVHDVVSTLVYAAHGTDVCMTVAGGRVVYEEGRVCTVDEDTVLAHAREQAAALVRRAGIASPPLAGAR